MKIGYSIARWLFEMNRVDRGECLGETRIGQRPAADLVGIATCAEEYRQQQEAGAARSGHCRLLCHQKNTGSL